MDKRNNILFIEDNLDHVELAKRSLKRAEVAAHFDVASSLKEAREKINHHAPDLVIADLVLPDGLSMELLTGSVESMPFPLVMITSQGDEKLAVESLKAGALDYIVKSDKMFTEFHHVIARALREWNYIVEHKILVKKEQKQYRLNQTLLDTSAIINSTLSLHEVFQRILTNLQRFITFDAASIFLIRGELAEIAASYTNLSDFVINEEPYKIKEYPDLQKMLIVKQPYFINDVDLDPFWVQRPSQDWVKAYMGVPLLMKDEMLGIVNLYSHQKDHFLEEDLPILTAFANHAAIAIENARLYAEIEMLSIKDELTRILNRRGLMLWGQRELDRLDRYSYPLSLFFMDIDQFKLFNDLFSYQVGDEVLKRVSNCLQTNLRKIDIVGRYGGDEFVAILPQTHVEEAVHILKRIQSDLAQIRLNLQEEITFPISISAGVCVRLEGDKTLESLIERGGKALHQAKALGKNQIFIAKS